MILNYTADVSILVFSLSYEFQIAL